MEGWGDRQRDGGQMEGQTERQIEGGTVGQAEGWRDRQRDRQRCRGTWGRTDSTWSSGQTPIPRNRKLMSPCVPDSPVHT